MDKPRSGQSPSVPWAAVVRFVLQDGLIVLAAVENADDGNHIGVHLMQGVQWLGKKIADNVVQRSRDAVRAKCMEARKGA